MLRLIRHCDRQGNLRLRLHVLFGHELLLHHLLGLLLLLLLHLLSLLLLQKLLRLCLRLLKLLGLKNLRLSSSFVQHELKLLWIDF